jgi:hypothetical protein
MRAAARSEARRLDTERCAHQREAASNREQPGATARSEAIERDSERQEAPLSRASHAHGFSSESEGQLWSGCVVVALDRAVQRSVAPTEVKCEILKLIFSLRCFYGPIGS